MLSADRRHYAQAEEYFQQAFTLATQAGDLRLEGLCRLNRAEVLLETQRYDEALDEADQARDLFARIGSRIEEADVFRLLGAIFRNIGRHGIAESNLLAACEHAGRTGAVLIEAEAARELGRLRTDQGRVPEAVIAFQRAAALFDRLGARGDLAAVEKLIAEAG